MITSTTNPEYTNLMHLAFDLVSQLIAGGFKLELSQNYSERVGNRYTATTPGNNAPLDRNLTGLYVLSPTSEVDPLYATQPWRLIIRVDSYYLNFWATTTKGYYFDESTEAFSFSKVLDHHALDLPTDFEGIYSYGSMSADSLFNPESVGGTFFTNKPEYAEWDVLNEDPTRSNKDEYPTLNDTPITYKLTIGTQGLAFAMWSTVSVNYGNNMSWFVVQRATEFNGTFDPKVGYSALKCVYSRTSGGDSYEGELDPMGILQFEVRERDCQLPTMPYSAVLPTYKKKPLINPRKQVSNDEATGMPRVLFMENPCSNRFVSNGFLDLVAYGDASSSVQGEEYVVDLFGDGNLRTYEALCANSPEGEGMRLYIATSGEDVNYETQKSLSVMFDQKTSSPYEYRGKLLKLNKVTSVDLATGYTETSSTELKFGLRYVSGDISKVKQFLVGNDESNLRDISYAQIDVLGYYLDLWVELDPGEEGDIETIVIESYDLDTGDAYDQWTINIANSLADGKEPAEPIDSSENSETSGVPNSIGFSYHDVGVSNSMNGAEIVARIINYGSSGSPENVTSDKPFTLKVTSASNMFFGPLVGNDSNDFQTAPDYYIPNGDTYTILWVAVDDTKRSVEHTATIELYDGTELQDTININFTNS